MISVLIKHEMEVIAVILRRIWQRRNKHIFQQKFDSPCLLINAAHNELKDFQNAQCFQELYHYNKQSKSRPQWLKPDGIVLKVNWDAALNVTRKKVGCGIIVRDG